MNAPRTAPTRRRLPSTRLGLLLGLALLVRVLLVLGSGAGLHVDEAQYWEWSRDLQWGYYSKPPVIAALIGASTALFGSGVLGIKALAMLCWVLTAWVLHDLAATLMRDSLAGPGSPGTDPVLAAQLPQRADAAGWWAALLFICSPVAGLLGLAATTDAPLLLCWALVMRQLWTALQRGGVWRWLGLGALLGLGLMSKLTMLALLPGMTWLIWRAGRTARLGGLLALLLAALLCVPNLAWNAALGWPTLQHTAAITTGASADPHASRLAALAEYLGGQVLLLGPVPGLWLLGCGLVGLWRWRQPRLVLNDPLAGARQHLWWLSWPLLAIGLAQALHAHAQVNWTAPASLGLLVWLALHLVEAPRSSIDPAATARRARHLRLAAWGVGVNLVLVLLVTGAPVLARWSDQALPARLDVWARMRGWQQALAELQPEVARHPGLPVLGGGRELLVQGAYAWRALPLDWRAWRSPGAAAQSHYELTRPLDALPTGSALLLLTDAPLDPELRARLDGLAPIATARRQLVGRPDQILTLWQARWCASACAPAASGASR